MKTAIVEIDGEKYFAVFNNAVLCRLEELHININRLKDSESPVSDISQMLCLMIDSGASYARRKGLGEYPVITLEDFREVTDLSDYQRFQALIVELIKGDRQVEAVPGKKAGAPGAEAGQPS